MKSFLFYLLFIGLAGLHASTVAGQENATTDTARFHVSGVCGQCKVRIENAALLKGIKWAQWDPKTNQLTLIYRPDKANLNEVHQAIANAGHDTEQVIAPDAAYKSLPRCCAYRDGIESH